MKLYTFDSAPNPRRLTLFMQYKGIDIESRQIDMRALEQLSEEYQTINPVRTVPALVLDDGTVLTEVVGIRYRKYKRGVASNLSAMAWLVSSGMPRKAYRSY